MAMNTHHSFYIEIALRIESRESTKGAVLCVFVLNRRVVDTVLNSIF